MPAPRVRAHHPDYAFLAAAALLVLLGFVFLASASSVVALQKMGDSYYYVKRQLLYGLAPGLLLFFVFAHLPYQKLRRLGLVALVGSLVTLGLVFAPYLGYGFGGAHRWLRLGPLLVQPSEFVKLAFLVYLAAWLESRGVERRRSFWGGLVPFALTAGLVIGLVVLQPDLGTASVLAVAAFATYFVAGGNLAHLTLLAGVGGVAGWFIIQSLSHSVRRLTVFLHPELDPQGIGYHINQALLAVGSGGFFGEGLGYSRQKYEYLPQVTGDSIFAIVAEELGFLFTSLVLALMSFFYVRGFRIAKHAPDEFGRYLATGILVWFAWQTCINIASMLGLLPLTGVPLPFVSYGGSALTTLLASLGILTNISRQAKPTGV